MEKRHYIGVKHVEAYPEEKDRKQGYAVIYPDGYKSWSPKDVFESAYFPINEPETLMASDVDEMLAESEVKAKMFGGGIMRVIAVLPTGYELTEVLLIGPDGNQQDAIDGCKEKIYKRLSDMMAFVLQWAYHGLKK